jgi:hypothetical protein
MIACFQGSSVAVHLGNGDGTFQPAVFYGVGVYAGPHSIMLGDFNGDGKTDMAVSESGFFGDGTTVTIWTGNGDGTFQTSHMDFGTGDTPFSLVAGDFNHDGILDLATANGTALTVSVLIGNGNGTFRARRDYQAGAGPTSVLVADFNNDAKLDLAVAAQSDGALSLLLGNGDGTFQSKVDYPVSPPPYTLASADLNGDGNQDLAVTVDTDAVEVLLGNGDGTFAPAVQYATSDIPVATAIADLNGDGKLDMAVAVVPTTGGGKVNVLLGNGDGTFRSYTEYDVPEAPYGLAVGDLNKDSIPDLVVADTGYQTFGVTVSVLLGNGDGTFRPHVDYDTYRYPACPVIADFNKDGNFDVAVAAEYEADVLLGNGDGTLRPYTAYSTVFAGRLVSADFNGDGNLDLAVGTGSASALLLGNGDGTFKAHVDYPMVGTWGYATGDFNHDGAPDLVGSYVYGSSVSVLLNTAGTFLKMTNRPNPSRQGQVVTFVVQLTPGLPGEPTPTGTITLKDGSKVLKTLTLRQGRVHYTTSGLSVGTHSITAVYSGDSTFNPNQISVTQVVR